MVHKRYSIILATVVDDDDDISMPSWPPSVRASGVLVRIPASTAREHGGKAGARRPGAHTPSPGLSAVSFFMPSRFLWCWKMFSK